MKTETWRGTFIPIPIPPIILDIEIIKKEKVRVLRNKQNQKNQRNVYQIHMQIHNATTIETIRLDEECKE